MDERITLLEHEVAEIKVEMVSIKANGRAAICSRLAIIETSVEQIKADIACTQGDVRERQEDLAGLQREVAQLKFDVTCIKTNLATKSELQAEIYKLESRMWTWLLAASVICMLGLQVAMFGYFIAFR
jgi:peptidoglycan hydrolase CwlO-like protein